jgi:histidyl-tRNA synthetase
MGSGLKEEFRSVRGIPDVLPSEVNIWLHLEQLLTNIMLQYGYNNIKLPVLEKTALFTRAIGEVTDIVEKEMFSLVDEKGRSLSLRPEGTAGCVRACLEHSLLRSAPQKLWYYGPMFRYEAPQKGRTRQFWQLGVECFGVIGAAAEVEQVAIFNRLWNILGVQDQITLEINNLGTPDARKNYLKLLVEYFNNNYEQLDTDSKRRLTTNPLRILDSKNPAMVELIKSAPKLLDYLDPASQDNFELFKQQLDLLQINYQVNPNIVRGLDYYTGNVWEWTSNSLGAQSAVGAGGRYDNLVEQLGGNSTPAVGLAIGIERLILLLQQTKLKLKFNDLAGYLICVGESALNQKFVIAEQVRNIYPSLNFEVDLLGGSFKSQFKRADKSGAKVALVVGDDEIHSSSVTIKCLRAGLTIKPTNQQQITIALQDLPKYLDSIIV